MSLMVIISMIALILVDQLTKIWAVHALSNGSDMALWEGVFHLHYISNTGAAWGVLSGKQTFLILFTSVVIIGMLYYMFKMPKTKEYFWTRVAFIMIISGAIGNLIDRIMFNYVRDFLYFKLIDFPIFNVADILVVVGAGLLMLTLFFEDSKKEVNN